MPNVLHILHLEDEPSDSALIQLRLSDEGLAHETARVDTPADFEAALRAGGMDIILSDQNLPGYDGQTALGLARALRPEIPFIFVSGALSEDQAIEMLRLGATDYVFKARLARLAPIVRRALQEYQVRADHRAADAQLQLAAQRQAQVAQASRAFAAATNNYQQLLKVVTRTVHALTGDACTLRLRSDDGAWLNHVITYHPNPEAQALQAELKAAPLPMLETLGDQPITAGQSLLVPEIEPEALRAVVPGRLWPLLERFPVYGVLAVPLRVRGALLGALIVTRGVRGRPLTAADQTFLESLADHAALALENAQTLEAEQRALEATRMAQARLEFLAATSAALVESLDYEATLQQLTRQVVPFLADWCVVDLLGDDGQLTQVAVAHVRPGREVLIRQLRSVYPPALTPDHPILQAIQTRQPLLTPTISEAELAARAHNAEHLGWLQALDIRSHIVMPLIARGQALGALSLVRTHASPPYTPADLALAEEVARRAAQAIDNARLYGEAQSLNTFLERRVEERTSALAEALAATRQANQDLAREVVVRAETEQRFRHLLENAPDATVIVDAEGQIVLANSQTEKLFGYLSEALVGQPVELLIPERFWERHVVHRRRYSDRPHPRPMGSNLDLVGRRRNGAEFPIEVRLGPLQTEAGLLISCSIRDITRRKQIADELRASHAQLQALMSRVQAVREEERALLAREVHDELGQLLSGLKMDVAWLRKQLNPDQPRLADKLQAMSQLLDTTIKTVRHIATELRPGLLDDFGLYAALEWHLGEFETRSGIATHMFTSAADLALPPDTAIAVYRVFQESLTNIARHAQATEVSVTLEAQADALRLEIKDNGLGFDTSAVAEKRTLGLAGMRERVEAFAGRLVVSSLPGHGTAIRVYIPIAAAQPAAESVSS